MPKKHADRDFEDSSDASLDQDDEEDEPSEDDDDNMQKNKGSKRKQDSSSKKGKPQDDVVLLQLPASSAAAATALSKTKGGPKTKRGKARPRLTNSANAITPWKSLQHHFMRHSDVKQRPDKKQTMSELSNEGLQRRNGWKVYHLAGQIDDLIDNELQVRDRLNQLLNLFETQAAKLVYELGQQCERDDTPHPDAFAILRRQRSYGRNEFNSNLIVDKLDDLIKGHLQRSTLFTDQMLDCKDVIMRISDEHRERVVRIISKSLNKRSYVFK